MSAPETVRWGRLVIIRGGAQSLHSDPQPESAPPGAGAPPVPGFRPEFDEYLRAQYGRTVDQAREFVEFVAPEPGSAVVEVGAGSGRVTFDGGLAARVGQTGQVLLTDPSTAQLNAAIRRAHDLGMGWIRALQARAEDLPLADGTADLVLGALFLHFTDQDRAIAEMARVVRPGGRVAVSTPLAYTWSDAWWDMHEPIRAELRRHGLPYRHFFPTADDVLARFGACGLQIERTRPFGPEVAECPSADLALAFCRQVGLVRLSLPALPADRIAAVEEEFEERIRAVFARTTPAERRITANWLSVVARRPE